MSAETNRRRRQLAVDTGALTLGTLISGLAAYGFILVGTRSLGAEAFAPVSILWTFWAASAAFITFPLQHWVIRSIEADGSDARVRSAIPTIALVALVLSAVSGGGAWLGRRSLFMQSGDLFPALAALIPLGSAAMGLMRGTLAGRRRFVLTGVAIAGENLIRVAVAVTLAALGAVAGAFGAGLIAGFGVAALMPGAFRFHDPADPGTVSPVAFLGGVAGGSFVAQVVLTSGPVVLAALGGAPAEVTALFAALAAFRAPYMVGTGVATRVTGTLTRLVVEGRRGELRKIWFGTLIVAIAGAVAAALFGLSLAPPLLRLAFGPDVVLPPAVVAVLASGSTLALGTLFYTLMLIARGRTNVVTAVWMLALLVAIVWLIASPTEPVMRVAQAFMAAEVTSLGAMLWADHPRR